MSGVQAGRANQTVTGTAYPQAHGKTERERALVQKKQIVSWLKIETRTTEMFWGGRGERCWETGWNWSMFGLVELSTEATKTHDSAAKENGEKCEDA